MVSSEMKLYKHAMAHKWTVDELIFTIKLIKSTDFKVEDVNVDLHKRVEAAPKQRRFAKSPVLKPLGALGRPERHAKRPFKKIDMHVSGI